MNIFWIIYAFLVILSIFPFARAIKEVYKKEKKKSDFTAVFIIVILSAIFPVSWFAAFVLWYIDKE